MLRLALLFFVLAIIAGICGFGGFIGGNLMFLAQICFFLFLVFLIISVVMGGWRSSGTPPPLV